MQEYDRTDRQIHWLSQVITKINRAFVPVKPDDSHTNFSFDPIGKKLFGRWIKGPDGRIIFSLNLQSLAFEWLDESRHILNEASFLDRPMDQLESAVTAYPASLSMETGRVFPPLHFEIPDYGFKVLSKKDIVEIGILNWINYRDLANRACQDVLTFLQAESEIRIWPHHLDTGIYTRVKKELGLGFGLAMKDSMVGLPYFYLAGYGEAVNIPGQGLPVLSDGRWETGGPWKGAVLPLDRLSGKSYTEALDDIRTFICEASAWYL